MEHLTPEQWKRYKAMDLDMEEFERIDAHLAECDECRRQLLSKEQVSQAIDKLLRLFSDLPSECITYDLLADYVDGRLDEEKRKQVEEHLKVCARCAEDLRSLDEFRLALQKGPESLPVPTASKPNWWQRLKSALTSRWLIALEGGAIMLLIILYAFHQGHHRLATQLQQLAFQISHLHEHMKGLQRQVQNLQQEQKQLTNLREQLVAVQQRLVAVAETQEKQLAQKPTFPLMTLKDTAGTVVLTEDRQLQMPVSLTTEWWERVREFVNGRVSQPKNVRLAMAKLKERVVVRSETKEMELLQLISPVATSVFPNQILFRWKGIKGVTQYRVLLANDDESGGPKVIWESQPTSRTSLTLPANAPALKPGAIYTWQVEATLGDEEMVSRPARFWVLDKKSASIVRKMKRQFSRSALTLVTVYATYGLREEALAQLHRLQRHNPDHPVVKLLQETVYQALPLKDR